ncbi:MAG: chloride channel protein [Dehalococcoidia bacterium]|nr:chloride channel protein [Dehalococcoidia bacterium]
MYPWNTLFRLSDDAAGIVLAAIIGICAGFGALAFWKTIEFFSWLFFNQGAEGFSFLGDHYVIILPMLGGLVFGPIVYFLAREAKGEGPPEIIEAIATRGGHIRTRVAATKILASSICIGSGGAVGREGPIVQIGGSIGSVIGQWFRVPERWLETMVLCGVAGGVSATFNAPIAGAFFALEVIQRRIIARNVGFVILSSVMAAIVARAFIFTEDRPTAFVVPEYSMENNQEILLYLLLGLITALVALAFMRFFYKTEDAFAKLNTPMYLKPAVGGLVVGVLGFISLRYVSTGGFSADIFGVGYGNHYAAGGEFLGAGPIDGILMGQAGAIVVLALLALKVLATSVTLGSGGSGGVFAPSLFMGAAVGSACGSLFQEIFPSVTGPVGAYALVGMAAFFAVVVQGPITAIIMLFELTRGYEMILPVMAAVVIAVIVARAFSRESIYTIRLKRKGIDLRALEERDVMRTTRVSDVMVRDFHSVPPEMPVTQLLKQMEEEGELGFPVINEDNHLVGIVSLSDVHAITRQEGTDVTVLTVADIATTRTLIVASPDQTLHEVLLQLGAKEVGRIPVVDRKDPSRCLGIIRRHDIVRAYIHEVSRSSHPQPHPQPHHS